MKDKIIDNRRKYFRVKYPYAERPKLMITEEDFDVIDISERGIKFSLGPTLSETITFHDGESLAIEGNFLRTQDNEIVIQPLKGIPAERINKEQRYLKKKYIGYR